jgi:hypothetical protein
MNTLDSCGTRKTPKGTGVYGMTVPQLRNSVVENYQKDGSAPSVSGLKRAELCYLLAQTPSGAKLIQNSSPDGSGKVSIQKKKTPTPGKKTPTPGKKVSIPIKKKGPSTSKGKDCNPSKKKVNTVCNPKTGNWIKKGGAVYKKLVAEGLIIEDGSSTPSPGPSPGPSPKSSPSKCNVSGLISWVNMSCYLDSTLFSILYQPNDYINQAILNKDTDDILISESGKVYALSKCAKLYQLTNQIQQDLLQIHTNIQTGTTDTCNLLRQHMHAYQAEYRKLFGNNSLKLQNWWKNVDPYNNSMQMEPLDALLRILHVFQVPDPACVRLVGYATEEMDKEMDKLKSSDLIKVSDETKLMPYTININAFDISNVSEFGLVSDKKETIYLLDYVDSAEETKYEPSATGKENYYWGPNPNGKGKKKYYRRIEHLTYVKAPFLHFNVQRRSNIISPHKTTTKINPPATIKLAKNNKDLTLSSIIVHHGGSEGGHYNAYVNCGGVWYHYDDGGPLFEMVGTLKDVLTADKNYVMKNLTDVFYM